MADAAATPTSSHEPLSWTALEFEKKDRHPDWIWYAGLVFGIGAALSFFYGSIFFGIFLCIAGAVTIIYALREPKHLAVTITADGITVNDGLIPYDKVKSFWLDETGKPDKLLLQVRGSFVPVISIPLDGVTSDTVRSHLVGKAPETPIAESTSAKIFDRFGF